MIATAADGGMRDALSTLDQALSFSESGLSTEDALLVTGAISKQALSAYVIAIAQSDVREALGQLDLIFNDGKNMIRFTEDLMGHFRDMLLADAASLPTSKGQIFNWIDIATDTLQTLKQTTQEKIAADVMTMRFCEASESVDYGQVIAELQDKVAKLTEKLETGDFQAATVETQKTVQRPKQSKSTTTYFSKEFVFKALSQATNEARQTIQNAWEEVINSFDSGFGKSMLQSTSAVAASKEFVVVTFESEFIAQKAVQNEELKVQFGNFMSNIVGFAPEIIALTTEDWLAIRSEYASLHQKQSAENDAVTITSPEGTSVPTSHQVVDEAQALFGDVVEVIED